MKTKFFPAIMHQVIILMLCMLCPFLYSCSDDDDESGGGFISKDDFIEVTYQGKTYHGTIPTGLYSIIEKDYDQSVYSNMSVPEEFRNLEVFYSLVLPTNLNELSKYKPGNYRIVEDPVYSEDTKALDFALEMDVSNESIYDAVGGVNKVTKITHKGDCAIVEGSFNVKMSNESRIYNNEQLKTFKMKGRYKMTLYE